MPTKTVDEIIDRKMEASKALRRPINRSADTDADTQIKKYR
ncbi:MAG: hypothetical protein WD317_11435 [Balneolaceae bacterium]